MKHQLNIVVSTNRFNGTQVSTMTMLVKKIYRKDLLAIRKVN